MSKNGRNEYVNFKYHLKKKFCIPLCTTVESLGHPWIKEACSYGPFFEKKYGEVLHIFFTIKLLFDWSKA